MTRKTLEGWRKWLAVGSAVAAGILGADSGLAQKVEEPTQNKPVTENCENCEEIDAPEDPDFATDGDEPYYGCTARARVENTDRGEEELFKTTLGFAFGDGRETIRHYHFEGEDQDWGALGVQVPKFKTGDVEHTLSIFGNYGDRDGLGVEDVAKWNGWTAILNLESNSTSGEDHYGFQLDKKVGKFIVGGAFDRVSPEEGDDKDFVLGHAYFQADENNQFGIGVREDFESNMTSFSGYWLNYGKDKEWGTRTWVRHDSGNNFESTTLDSIIAQNPTFSKFSAYWIAGRRDGEMFNETVVDNPLSPEAVYLDERTADGLAFEIKGNRTENGSSTTGFVGGDVAYRWQEVEIGNRPVDIGIKGGYKHLFGDSDSGVLNAGGGLGFDLGPGEVSLRAGLEHPLNEEGEDELYTSVQYCVSF